MLAKNFGIKLVRHIDSVPLKRLFHHRNSNVYQSSKTYIEEDKLNQKTTYIKEETYSYKNEFNPMYFHSTNNSSGSAFSDFIRETIFYAVPGCFYLLYKEVKSYISKKEEDKEELPSSEKQASRDIEYEERNCDNSNSKDVNSSIIMD